MRLLTIFLLPVLLFLSCSNEQKQDIALFNDYQFRADSTEQLIVIDSVAKVPYMEHFNNLSGIQIPLYRILGGKEYTIYLGLPFHTSPGKIATAKRIRQDMDSILQLKETADCFYLQYRKKEFYYTEYIRDMDSINTIAVFSVTQDPYIADTVFSDEKIKARIFK